MPLERDVDRRPTASPTGTESNLTSIMGRMAVFSDKIALPPWAILGTNEVI